MVAVESFSLLLRESAGELYADAPLKERWAIGARVGVGGNGAVHIANRVDNRGVVAAVKVIAKSSILNNTLRMRLLLSEVKCASIAQSPPRHVNIVTVYEVCEDAENVYIVQEYIDGGELFEVVASCGSSMQERDCAVMMRALLSAVDFLHRRGIAHRDIKPENVMFVRGSDVGRAKLIDFGVSFHESQSNLLNRIPIGSPMYIAPEVMHRDEYTYAADVWSLGIVAFVCLTGMLPYDLSLCSDSLLDIALEFGVCFDIPEFRALSPQARDFVHAALHPSANRRPSVRELIEHPWITRYVRVITLSTTHESKFRAHIEPIVALRASRVSSVCSEVYTSPPRIVARVKADAQATSAEISAEPVEDCEETDAKSGPPVTIVVEDLKLSPSAASVTECAITPAAIVPDGNEQTRCLAAILDLETDDDLSYDSDRSGLSDMVAFSFSGEHKPNPTILNRLGSHTDLWSTKNLRDSRFNLKSLLKPQPNRELHDETSALLSKIQGVQEELNAAAESSRDSSAADKRVLSRKMSENMSGMLSRVLSINREALPGDGDAGVEC
mmetsp:Transcript_11259/g.30300  ORF Transcript_11259/g.30300 Transcript_11259/m.30300 type:complete len:556 (+) Transcript_11259:316-1983(+)